MDGLKLQKIQNNIGESSQPTNTFSDFVYFFSSIIDKTTEFYWLIEGGYGLIFNLPESWFEDAWYDEKYDIEHSVKLDEFESHFILDRRSEKSFILTEPDFLKKYAKYIVDDWWDIIGFYKPPHDIEDYFKKLSEIYNPLEKANFLDKTADICFFNIDAAYWEIFAQDHSIIKSIVKDTESKSGFNATTIKLINKTA